MLPATSRDLQSQALASHSRWQQSQVSSCFALKVPELHQPSHLVFCADEVSQRFNHCSRTGRWTVTLTASTRQWWRNQHQACQRRGISPARMTQWMVQLQSQRGEFSADTIPRDQLGTPKADPSSTVRPAVHSTSRTNSCSSRCRWYAVLQPRSTSHPPQQCSVLDTVFAFADRHRRRRFLRQGQEDARAARADPSRAGRGSRPAPSVTW